MRYFDGITDFIFVEHRPEKADIIFVPGGTYPDAARRAAQLYHEGYAPRILPSGRFSILKERFELPEQAEEAASSVSYPTEWAYLSAVLQKAGVPREVILCEEEATFTWENAIYSRRKTDALGLVIGRAILCCQAFHARRSLMYYQQQFPETQFLVCPVVTRGIARDSWYQSREGIDTVLGEVERCGAQFHEILAAEPGVRPSFGA